jgi:hypothetical protein
VFAEQSQALEAIRVDPKGGFVGHKSLERLALRAAEAGEARPSMQETLSWPKISTI